MSEQLYVVRNAFKASGVLYPAGLLLTEEDLHGIKLFKIRLNEGTVRPVPTTEQELDSLCNYFSSRTNLDLKQQLVDYREKIVAATQVATPPAPDNPTPGTNVVKPLSQTKVAKTTTTVKK
jgi:hypothetical protein